VLLGGVAQIWYFARYLWHVMTMVALASFLQKIQQEAKKEKKECFCVRDLLTDK